jgi:hypothetical protein
MLKMVIVILMLRPDLGGWRVAEVALPAGTAQSVCEGAGARVEAMRAAEAATGWVAWDSKCVIRRPA